MPKEYTKIDSQRFASVETKQELKTYNIVELKDERSILVARLTEIDTLLAEADKLGVVAKVEVEEEPLEPVQE